MPRLCTPNHANFPPPFPITKRGVFVSAGKCKLHEFQRLATLVRAPQFGPAGQELFSLQTRHSVRMTVFTPKQGANWHEIESFLEIQE